MPKKHVWFVLPPLLVAAASLRMVLIWRQWPASNSDEATMAIMALHIADGRHLPNFYYGQSYMGSAQAYLGAELFNLVGPSVEALRVGLVLLYLAFLAVLFVLARQLYPAGVALAAVGLLVLGSRELYGSQLVAFGGLPETLLAGATLLLIGYWLLAKAPTLTCARRRWLLAGWGLVAALGLWSDMLVGPFVAGSALLLWRARVWWQRSWWPLLAGLLAGATPFIAHDLTHPLHRSSVVTFLRLYASGGSGGGHQPDEPGGPLQHLVNTVGTSLAYATGGSSLAHHNDPPAWPAGWSGGWRPATPHPLDALWGLALVSLWAVALVMTLRALRQRHRRSDPRLWGRLSILASAGLTVAAYAASQAPQDAPANRARYLIGLLVATPAVIHPLWRFRWTGRPVVLAAAAVLALGTVAAFRDAYRADQQAGPEALTQALLDRGVTRVYTGYWTCNRLAFASKERIVCAVVDSHPDGLRHGLDRYLPYRATVLADPGAAYVIESGPPRVPGCAWHEPWEAVGYQVWQPVRPCPPLPDPDPESRF